VDTFAEKVAVVTGGGSGMGRELVIQLAAAGCSVATCDLNPGSIAETVALAQAGTARGARVTGHLCDVSDEAQVLRFRDEVLDQHGASHLDLVFNNAGIGGGGSFITDPREAWERVFAVDWWGVYYCTRAFLPLLIASTEAVLVNTSSVNGFWASLGPGRPHTAYSSAKFAVKGFSEALIEDLRMHAPHVRVAVVMPGHIGTDIVANSLRAHGMPEPAAMTGAELDAARARMVSNGVQAAADFSDDQVRQLIQRMSDDFRDNAPLSASGAATVILDAVLAGTWRILVGDDAKLLDSRVRESPETAYDPTDTPLIRIG
jgi:NAD(P)-dependent dehydrogenase (short-subunit alcohol dehydrogenase family)